MWGYVSYYSGHKNVWICLDRADAELDTLYPGGAPGVGEAQPAEKDFTKERIAPGKGQNNLVILVVAMVLLVVLVTGGLLLLLRRKGDK